MPFRGLEVSFGILKGQGDQGRQGHNVEPVDGALLTRCLVILGFKKAYGKFERQVHCLWG